MTIIVNSVWSMNNSANIKTPRVRFGGISGTEYVNTQIGSNNSFQSECLIRFRNALNSQTAMSATQWSSYGVGGVVALGQFFIVSKKGDKLGQVLY